MKKNNIIKLLVFLVIVLSISLIISTLKLISIKTELSQGKVPKPKPIEKPTEQENQVDEDVILEPKYISTDQAIDIGLKKVGHGSELIKVESDLDNNPPKYELEIILGNYEYEIEIHAITGSLINFEKDDL